MKVATKMKKMIQVWSIAVKMKEVPQWMSTAMTSRCFNVEGVADKAEKEMLKKGCAASLSWSV